MKPQISVILTNYNYGAYLNESLKSVLEQDFKDYELIVIDDGSTDDSRALISQWSAKFNGKMRHVFQENRGIYYSENLGLQLSQGDYVTFLDADDIWLENTLSQLSGYLDAHPDEMVVYGDALEFDSKTEKPIKRWFDKSSGRYPYQGHCMDKLLSRNFIPKDAAMIRRPVVETTGGFDASFKVGGDWDFWLRVSAQYKISYLDAILCKVRRHPANISFQPSKNALVRIRILRMSLKRYPTLKDTVDPTQLRKIWCQTYYDLGRALFLNGKNKRSRKMFKKAWSFNKNIFMGKIFIFFVLSYLPHNFTRALKKTWRTLGGISMGWV